MKIKSFMLSSNPEIFKNILDSKQKYLAFFKSRFYIFLNKNNKKQKQMPHNG